MEAKEVGQWKKLKVLGSGGFGQVTLWFNSTTGQKIAIKKLHDQPTSEKGTTQKQIERWCKEVDIMKQLKHGNIVATLEVPPDFAKVSRLPLLAMEYCSNGDLRGVLNKPENCSGLPESEVLDVLRDVSSGLAYLHSCKIIHRDLKPDNIVLMQKESRIVYKLIDLGYAKALDQNSLSESFVGTIQYIAPELFLGKAYTSSVDYWSFGLVAHEIITGYRPFLPGFNPSDWMRQIQNKARNVICVLENANGDITFSTSISRRNHLSRCFLADIEKWLRLALDWDGQTRGRDPDRNRPVIFEQLGNILRKKVITVFSVPTYETLTYEVSPETDVVDLRNSLRKETHVDVDNQLLLMTGGKSLNMKGNLMDAIKTEKLDRQGVTLFLFNLGSLEVDSVSRKPPKFVCDLIETADLPLKRRHLKRACAESVYYMQSEAMRYRRLLQGIGVKISHTKQKTLSIESMYEDVGDEWSQIESYAQFLSLSHKIDLENYIHFRKTGKLKASSMVQKWIQNVMEVDRKVTELKNSFNKNEQKQLVFVARQRCRHLDNHSGADPTTQKTPLDDIVAEGQKLWGKVNGLAKNTQDMSSNAAAVTLIKKSMEESEKLLTSQMIQPLLKKINEADENLSKFLTHLTTLLKSTKILRLVIENTQRERQRNVWNLVVGVADASGDEKSGDADERGESVGKEIEVTKVNGGRSRRESCNSTTTGMLTQMDHVAVRSHRPSRCESYTSLESALDASSIIEDNNRLRYKMQEVQQICDSMVKEIRSLRMDA